MRFVNMVGANDPLYDLDAVVGEAQRAESLGFQSFAMAHVFNLDAIAALTVAARETERIELLTAVVPTYPRHPFALAQQALTAQVASGGRFTLGIGLSHRIVIESMLGFSYDHPADHMREYLEVLNPLLRGEPAHFEGRHYRVNAQLQLPGTPPVPVLLAALGPAMLRLCGRAAAGTITWLAGRKTLDGYVGPTLRRAAAQAGRPEPRIVASLPIALTRDPDGAREVAARAFRIYGHLPSYRAMLDREGAAGPADVAIVGDESTVEAELERLAAAGVTDFAASLFEAEEGSARRTERWLGELARKGVA